MRLGCTHSVFTAVIGSAGTDAGYNLEQHTNVALLLTLFHPFTGKQHCPVTRGWGPEPEFLHSLSTF